MIRNSTLFLTLLICLNAFSQHPSTTKLFSILERLYETEDHKTGLNSIKDLEKKLLKYEGDSSLYYIKLKAYSALFNGSLNNFDSYKKDLSIATEQLTKYSPSDTGYNQAALITAKALMLFGDYTQAKVLLNQIKTPDENILFELHKCNYELGFLNEVQKQLQTELITCTGHQKVKRLLLSSTIESDQQKEEIINNLKQHLTWVESTYKNKSGYKSRFLFLLGKAYLQKEDYRTAEDYFSKSISSGGKHFPPHSNFLDLVFAYRYKNLLLMGKKTEADYNENLQDVKVLSYFGKKSKNFLIHGLTEIEALYDYGNINAAYNSLTPYNKNTPYFPSEHIERLAVAQTFLPILLEHGNFKLADSVLTEGLKLAENKYGSNSPKHHEWLLEKASFISLYTNSIDSSISLFEESLPIIKNNYGPSHPTYLRFFSCYIKTLFELNEYNKAKNKLEDENDFLLEKAQLNITYTNIEQARKILKTKTDKLNSHNLQVKGKIGKAQTDRLIAQTYLLEGDYFKADSIFNLSDKSIQFQFYHQQFTSLIKRQELVLLSTQHGKFKRKIKEELIKKTTLVGDRHYSIIALQNLLCRLSILTGEFKEAESLIASNESIIKNVFSTTSLQFIELCKTKKALYDAIGDYKNSEDMAKIIVELLEQKFQKEHINTALPLSEWALARSYNKNTDTTFTHKLISKSLSIIKKEIGNNKIIYAKALTNSGFYNLLQGNYTEAKTDIQNAQSIWQSNLGSENEKTAELDLLLGNINMELEDFEIALQLFQNASKTYNKVFNNEHPTYINARGMEARALFVLKKNKEAIAIANEVVDKSLNYVNIIFPNLSEREKTNYWYKVKDHFEFYNTLAFTSAKEYPNMIGKVFDINLQTKAILLNASIKLKNEILNSNDPELFEKYNEWLELKELLTQAISKNSDERKAENIDLNKLGNKIETIEKYLGQQTVSFSKNNNNKQYKWQTLKDNVNKEDHIIETIAFRVFDKRFTDSIWYAALEVNADTKNNPSYAVFKNGNFMHTKGIAYYRQCIKYGLEDTKSFHSFWKPIDSLITKKGSVYISYEGIYNRLNPETFIAPNNEYLVNKYNIIPIGTARDLIDNQIPENTSLSKTAEFIGNPNFYSNTYTKPKRWSQLPGTEKEVNYLHKYLTEQNWSSTITKEEAATEKYLKSISNPDIFHIATHGFYIEKATSSSIDQLAGKTINNPLLRSGIMLQHGGEIYDNSSVHEFNKEDGILTAHEAMGLKLDKTSLVVLSACETGLGEIELGEGVFGLQRSFTVAGAKTIIISLFKVSDEVTTELMKKFYEEWIATNNKQQAFITAKKEIMKTYKEPSLWGAFLMISSSLSN